MTITRTRTTIAAAIASIGIASALPAVSQAKPHKSPKAPAAHVKHHHHVAPVLAKQLGAPTIAPAKTTVPVRSGSPLQPSVHLAVGTTGATTGTPVSTITVKRVGVGKLIGPVSVHLAPVVAELQGGSAGVPGYDDKACESLAGDYNKAVNELEQGLITGDEDRTSKYGNLANLIYGQLTDNCMVVY